MTIINLLEWDITYKEFVTWIVENGVDAYAIASHGANDPITKYMIEKDEDMTAFKLAFSKEKPIIMGFKGNSTAANAYYYAPYIPIIHEKS
jgi:hypothetical protein